MKGASVMAQWFVVWYGLSSFLLGLLLFWPLRKFILALSVNRYQRRTQETMSAEAFAQLRHKVSLIAAVVSMTFAFLYNRFVLFHYFG